MQEYDYDVALSFAGEDRELAEALAELLKNDGYKVFYDKYEVAQLWGENLYDNFSEIYKNRSRYCVMFASKHYAQKPWANHERQNAQARAFENSVAYILPIRLDDTEIPGILPTVGYLDGRSMSINEIYLILKEKLTGEPSPVTSVPTSPTTVEDDSGEFVLFGSEEGELYFFPFQDVRRDSNEISLKLLSESSGHVAFLNTLQNKLDSTFSTRITLSCAYKEYAAWVNPKNIVEAHSHWEILLNSDNRWQDADFFANMTVGNFSPHQIAEMRARRILLNEKLNDTVPALGQNNPLDQTTLELHVGGMPPSTPHERKLQVTVSPIPDLYQQFTQTPGRFKKFARLISILYLKLTNTVENILELDFELLAKEQLQVKFKGTRPQIYTSVPPSTLEFEGICALSE